MPGKLYKTQPPVLSFIYDATGCSLLARQRCCSFRRDPFLLTCPPLSQPFGYIIPATPEFFACRHPSNYNKSSRRKYQKLNPPETMLKVLIKVLPIGMGLKFLLYFIGDELREHFFRMRKCKGRFRANKRFLMPVRSSDSESHESDIESRVLSLGC